MANAKEIIEKIKDLVGLSKSVETNVVVENITPEVKLSTEIKTPVEKISIKTNKVELAEDMPIYEPQPIKEVPAEINIEEKVAELEVRISELEKLLEMKDKTITKKDEKIEELSKQNVELSAQPIVEPIKVESNTAKETFASVMMERLYKK